jgi:predicted CoA-substrate-specific enzyme activase
MDEKRRILAKEYLMTAGQPLEAVREGLRRAGEKVGSKVDIAGAATTGSGRYLTGDFIGADIVINEITAQAAGATIINPAVDTIFEIGGQDSKYISLQNGVVVDFEMNHACAAGTGSFLEEQAQRLGININEEFAETAFKSKAPIKLGERCTVFIESDLLSYQQQGARTEDLVAGLSYSIVANYLNRVVGRRRIGDNICFQGGTAFNKAVWSAFEAVTGKEIMVPDHHEVTGALGAASIAAEHMKSMAEDNADGVVSGFKGFDSLVSGSYEIKSFKCNSCANECEIKRVELAGSEPLFYGSRCDKYNVKKGKRAEGEFDAFEWRRQKMLEFAGLDGQAKKIEKSRGTIGIPMALVSWQLLPMFSEFFRSLGFEVVVSKWTDKGIIRKGVELVTAQTCFPVKVAYGHVAQLVERGVDYIFIPSVVSMGSGGCKNTAKQLCPYVQSFVYQAKTAFAGKLGDAEILTAVFRLGEGDKLSAKSFAAVGKQLKVSRSSVRRAVERGVGAQDGFEKALREKGKEIISGVSNDEKLFVLISRPYNGCDDGLNLRLSSKLSELGVKIIPMDMLDIEGAQLSGGMFNGDVYWTYGRKILRAGGIIRKDKRLFAIYLSNFGCGPDSFLLTFFKELMGAKPCLQLELDEHSADAGVITRLEAFLESLKHYKYKDASGEEPEHLAGPKVKGNGRKLYVPYMGDGAYGVAACFRAYGQDAEVMPVGDEEALLLGRKFTTGKECLPCAITAGDILSVVNRTDFDAGKSAFFMPGASGPCRFGMYSCLHRMILRQAGVRDAIIISPNQNNNFYEELVGGMGNGNGRGFMKDVWAAAAGVDLLHKVILKLRPYARDPGEAQRVYDRCVESWCREVEKRKNMEEMAKVMAGIAEELAGVDLDKSEVKPVIGIVGEIYVRSHRFANSDVIRRLEALGAECELASFAEWMYYTAYVRKQEALREGRKLDYLKYVIENIAQHRIERAVARPLEQRFGKLADGAIEDAIECAKPYLHDSFEGEAVLSVGKMVEYYHAGAAGVVNVMPFGCMPSTVVNTQTRRISSDCGDMPILNLSFDGHEDATLTTRLEAFVEQGRGRISSKSKVQSAKS